MLSGERGICGQRGKDGKTMIKRENHNHHQYRNDGGDEENSARRNIQLAALRTLDCCPSNPATTDAFSHGSGGLNSTSSAMAWFPVQVHRARQPAVVIARRI